MTHPPEDSDSHDVLKKISALEDRVARLEEQIYTPGFAPVAETTATEPRPETAKRSDEEIEFQLGQNWFARFGIVILAIGMAFLLTLPFEDLPQFLPALIGYFLTGGIFLLSRMWRESFSLLSGYLRGAGMALLYFATLRLFFFGKEPPLVATSVTGLALLLIVSGVNLTLAVRRRSPYLLALALTTAFATAVVVGTTWFMLVSILALTLFSATLGNRFAMSGFLFYGICMTYFAHLDWAVSNPLAGNPPAFLTEPLIGLYSILLSVIIFGAGTLLRKTPAHESPSVAVASFLNGAGAYALFLILTLGGFETGFSLSHLTASLVLLSLAVLFWVKEKSRYSTFIYAMLGYMALSVALLKEFETPDLFVWLSVQSLVVVATAVWFRSRFIVVANFVIFIGIIIGYLIVAREETGIGLGFGIVALASARILNWQKDRLELKTEIMRNAYLVAAFAAFPYGLYHLVPREYVTFSWIGIAGFYYAVNAVIRNPKYRWMGHLTLILTALYVLIIGIIELSPTYRIISFLVLAVALITVSMLFTRMKRKRREREEGDG